MNKSGVSLLAMTLGAALLSSCGPSYPKERVAQAMVDLCRKEYGLDVKAQWVETTFGVLVEIPGLLEELMKEAPAPEAPVPLLVEGEYKQETFQFQFLAHGTFYRAEKEEQKQAPEREETPPRKILKQVSLALSRISLSTDAPLEFFTLIARDPGPANVDLLFSGHIVDLKRVQYLDISIGEYQKRSRFGLRHQPEAEARQIVLEFLSDLIQKPLPQVLNRHLGTGASIRTLFPQLLELVLELQGRKGSLSEKEWPIRQIAADQALVVVPLSGVDLEGSVLFLVRLGQPPGAAAILEIERLREGTLPERYRGLGSVEKWAEFFYVEPIRMSQFLTEQIARRILSEFQMEPPEPTAGLLQPKATEPPQPVTPEEVVRTLVETTAYLVNSYRYTGYKELTVTDASKGSRWVIKPKDLPIHRRRNTPIPQPTP